MSRSERPGNQPRVVSVGMSARLVTADSPLPDLLDGFGGEYEPDGDSILE
ncbi:hypothetical protein [Hardygib1 virus]|nr:hypothetical protein [Hardygib1 virus]